jgi:hypothetical protein
MKPQAEFRIRKATTQEVEELTKTVQTQDLSAMSKRISFDTDAVSEATTQRVAAAAPAAPTAPVKVKTRMPAPAPAPAQAQAQAPMPDLPEEMGKLAKAIHESEHSNPYRVESPVYPLQTRRGFNRQILKVFREFIKIPDLGQAPDFDACKRLGAGAQEQLEMYEYQKFVRDYVRQATPYRGLLVYHGLGSGKTCSAIAAAEAMFGVSNKRIIVMTPFSLRDNFIREVTFCGFRHFRLQNHWVKLDPTPTSLLFATQILGVPKAFADKATAIWAPDFDKAPNLAELNPDDRAAIQKQLQAQINERITFINYNGITASKLKELACTTGSESLGTQGPFDNAIIVVDEIHNLTRLMQGTIEPYLTTLPTRKTRTIPLEPVTPGRWIPALCKKVYDPRRPYQTNYKRGYLLYRLLATARNSKIIGLSGTPLINFPEELAILINLLGGYIHTAAFSVEFNPAEQGRTYPSASQKGESGTVSPTNATALLQAILHEHPFVDFERVEPAGLSIRVLFTLLPEGTKKVRGPDGEVGAERLPPGQTSPTIEAVVAEILDTATKKGFKTVGTPEYKSEPLLPPIGDEFRAAFLTPDGKGLKNTIVLRKRIQGLISYYRGSKKELMPTVTRDELVRVPFSPYAQAEYSRVRAEEIEAKLKQKTQPTDQAVAGSSVANLWAELYDLAKMKSPNSYRMASRQACNFAFPEGIARPRPRNQAEAVEEAGKAEIQTADGTVELSSEPDQGEAEAEDAAIEESATRDAVEKAKEEGSTAAIEAELAAEEAVLIKGADVAPATAEVAPQPRALTAANQLRQQRVEQQEACKAGFREGEKYLDATRRAKKCLETFATPRLRLYPMGKKVVAEATAGAPPLATGLINYSPKFAAILSRILDAPGSSLVYSQFLDMEGIGIFQSVLRINDFLPLTLESDEGTFRFSDATLKGLSRPNTYRYLSFTGSETREQKAMALRVFNARYDEEKKAFTELPPSMSDALVAAGFTGNLRGELCRVFCITSAGAEGLSLRNVRRVHIMEPYWNHVRTDQVKGRAVRICSHIDLDYNEDLTKNQRTVEVFTYCSTFHPTAMVPAAPAPGALPTYPPVDMTIVNMDGVKPADAKDLGLPIPEGARDYVMTSDEYLYVLSENKKKLLKEIQDLMKTSAVDCEINEYENEEEGIGCLTLPGKSTEYAFDPVLSRDIADTTTAFQKVEAAAAVSEATTQRAAAAAAPTAAPAPAPAPRTLKARVITVDGVSYIAIPIKEAGGAVLRFNLYGRSDLKRKKLLGTALADTAGNPTSDIVLL